jgi:monovalent cation:H+ antiporter-2, CPA2 family
MIGHEFLDFWILIVSALGAFVLSQKVKSSLGLGYLAAGLILGPLGFGVFVKSAFLDMLSHIGMILFLFTVGLEIPFHRIHGLRRYIFGFGLTQVGVTALVLTALLCLWIPLKTAFILALALSFSSTAVIVQLLSERHELTTQLGRITLSILLFQDVIAIAIFVWLALENAAALAVSCPNIGQGPAPLVALLDLVGLGGLAGFISPVTLVLLKSIVGLAVSLFLGFCLTKVTERALALHRYSEFITAYVIAAFLGLSLLTDACYLSSELGAFIAGIAMASTHWRHQISAEIHPFRTLFLALFFMTLGLEIQAWPDLASFGWIVLGLVCVGAIKTLVVVACGLWYRMNSPVQLAILVGSSSEFLFMIVPNLRSQLGDRVAGGLLVMGLLSMMLTPLLFLAVRRFIKGRAASDEITTRPLVVIAGFGHVGQTIARILEHNFVPFMVVDYEQDAVDKALQANYPAIHGDPREIEFLKRIKVYQAKVLLITFGHLSTTTELVRMLRRKFPELTVCVQVRDYIEASRFAGLGVHVVVPEIIESGMQMASMTLQSLGFSQDYAQKMVSFPQTPHFFGVQK